MKCKCLIVALIVSRACLHAQELFPLAEPASTMPKNVLGVRALAQFYKEAGATRSMYALRFMYGLTPRFTVWVPPHGSTARAFLLHLADYIFMESTECFQLMAKRNISG